MAVIKTIEKGESLTFGFVLPETYNLANLQSVKIYIGSTVYAHTMVSRTARVELTSNATALLTGRNVIHFVIDDAIFGIKKVNCGMLEVLPTQATHKDTSINTGYDVEVVLTIDVETVSVESVLYNVLKGDTGAQGIQGEKGDKGDSGDFFVGQFNEVIDKLNLVWVDGWVHIDTGTVLNPWSDTGLKKIDVGYMVINTGQGTIQSKPIVHYPSSITTLPNSIPTGFYVKDSNNLLTENADFETIEIRYNIVSDTIRKYDGTVFKYGYNAVLDESTGSAYHSASGVKAFQAVYPEFAGSIIQTVLDGLTDYSGLEQFFTPNYCKTREANIISKPYSNASITESVGSNADILTIAAHYGNTFERRDITANATTFLKNVIAIGSCQATGIPTVGTSYGYGMEFAEVGNNLGLNAAYPDATFNHNIGYGTGSGNAFTDSILTRDYENILELSVGTTVRIGLSESTLAEYTIATLSGNTFTTVEALNLEAGVNYVYITAHIGTVWQPVATNNDYYQSPVTSIIMAKFRKIQDLSGANWHICRLAARATASNGGVWDMYRGFGIIDVDAAVQYITDNYKSLEYRAMLADQHDGLNGISPFPEYADFLPDSPLPKRLIPAIFWDDEARTYYFDTLDGGQIQIGQEPHDYYTNLNGSQVVNGDIVSVVGASGNRTAIALTDVTNDASAMKCIGMVTVTTIGNNNVGRITKSGGKVRTLNTAAYSEGDVLFVDPANPGKWTNVQPEAPLRCVRVGYVTVSHATEGVVELAIDIYQKFVDSCDVDGTPLTESGQIPVWDDAREVFDFTENINDFKPIEYAPSVMTVQRGTLTQGTVADLAAVGGTDVIIQELAGADPLRVLFAFNDVRKIGFFSFYGRYAGGAMHILWIEAYNNATLTWDLLGELSNFTSKQWFGYNMFLAENYISEAGIVLVRMNHQGTGIATHTLTLDYVDVHFGGGGGSSVRTAATIESIPAGNLAATNVQAALNELDDEKVAKVAGSSLITDTEKVRLSTVKTLISDTTYENVWKTGALSVDPVTGIFTYVAHGLADTNAVEFRANTGVLPTGIEAYNSDVVTGTYYNVINKTNDTFQITATVGGATPVLPSNVGTAGYQIRPVSFASTDVNLPIIANYDNEIVVNMQISFARIVTGSQSFSFRINSDANAKYIGFTSAINYQKILGDWTLKYALGTMTFRIRRISATELMVNTSATLLTTDNKSVFTAITCPQGTVNIRGLAAEATKLSMIVYQGTERVRSIRAIITA